MYKSQESKVQYYPYYWMMFDSLLCHLVHVDYSKAEASGDLDCLEKDAGVGAQEFGKILKTSVDYGFLAVYENEKDREYRIEGLICLAECSF